MKATTAKKPTVVAEPSKDSQATIIVKLAFASRLQVFHTPAGDAYGTVIVNDGHREHHRLHSRATLLSRDRKGTERHGPTRRHRDPQRDGEV
jgi:hypothetical protein